MSYIARATAPTVLRPPIFRRKKYYKYKRRVYCKRKPYRKIMRYRNVKYSRGLPARQFIRFKMKSDAVEVNPGGGAKYKHFIFNLNSIFDPMGVNGTEQPFLYDTFASLYDNYRVFSGFICCRYVNSNSNPVRAAFGISTDSTAQTDIRALAEQKGFGTKFATASNGSKNTIIFMKRFSVGKYMAKTDISDQTALIAGNPAEFLLGHLFVESVKYDNAPDDVMGMLFVTIYQNTMLYNVDQPAPSSA